MSHSRASLLTKAVIWKVTRIVNLLLLIAMMVAMAILQDKIAGITPSDAQSATALQSWMTFFTILFAYLAFTEIYDDTELMLCRPRAYRRELARRVAERRRMGLDVDDQMNAMQHLHGASS